MGLLGTVSAIGTALGPALGGVLLAGFGWRALFLVNVPLGILTFWLAYYSLPAARPTPKTARAAFDIAGALLLMLTLAAYALAMTNWRGSFGASSLTLLLIAAGGAGLFRLVEARAASPLIRWTMFRDSGLSASLVLSALVSTVMMATLVVGPFYLSRVLALNAALVGAVMTIGPLTSMLAGVLAGRHVDRLGAPLMIVIGLSEMAVGLMALAVLPACFGIGGYIAAVLVLSPGYQMFQAANNTAVMLNVQSEQRGVFSGLLNLSRNLGLITGASVMGALFAFGSGTSDITTARPEAVATGMQITFAVAACLTLVALASALRRRALTPPPTPAVDAA